MKYFPLYNSRIDSGFPTLEPIEQPIATEGGNRIVPRQLMSGTVSGNTQTRWSDTKNIRVVIGPL